MNPEQMQMQFDRPAPTKSRLQREILRYLERGGVLTDGKARVLFSTSRLASQIERLRKRGYAIHTELVVTENARGEKVRIAEYSM